MQAWKTESVKLCASAGRGRSGQVESREEEEVEREGGGGGDDEYLPADQYVAHGSGSRFAVAFSSEFLWSQQA
jgi:hypothetical protein